MRIGLSSHLPMFVNFQPMVLNGKPCGNDLPNTYRVPN